RTITYLGRFADLALITDVTEQNLAKQELKESEEKYRLLFENMNSGFGYSEVVVNDDNKPIDYRFIEANSQFEKLTGLKVSDIIGKTVTEVLPGIENDPADWIGRYGKVGLTGEPLTAEDYSEPLDRWYNVSGYSPKKGFFAVTFSDITDRKRAEKKLKESEKKYRHLFDTSPYFIGLIDTKSVLIDCNDVSNEILSLHTKEDIIGKNIIEIFSLNEKNKYLIPILENFIKNTFEGAGTNQEPFDFQLYRSIGGYLWLHIEGTLIEIEKQQLIQFIIQDITERKQAEEKLKDSEEKYRHLFENSPFSIVLLNNKGKIIDMNPKTTELFGYKKEDLIDENYLTLTNMFPKETIPGLRLVQDLMSKGEPSSPITRPQITKIYNKDKKTMWVASELSTVSISGELMILTIIQDITEKKLAEEKLKESERILRQQNIELKELDRLKTDFISIAAHDLKTPLISVGGYVDLILLREKGLKEEVKEDLNRVLSNVHRLDGYINRLLDVMKIEAKKVELVKREENIHAILIDCLSDLEFQISQKDLTVNVDISEYLNIRVDNFRISQALLNLLSNAVKFTPKNGKIDISVVEEDENVLFKIKDNGKGLTPEEIQKLFGKFVTIEQGVDGYSTFDKGSGLGLYIARGFIEAHGGKIWVESKGRDLGAEFNFTLPK
ncbi:MAG: PAS domain-containing sensor histidine kinase, partial [Promethearchaeota archaeon]